MKETKRLWGFVGAGQMALALARGFVQAGLVNASDLLAYDPSAQATERFQAAVPGAKMVGSNLEVAQQAQVLILAVKPQHLRAAAQSVHGKVSDRLVISIAAGVRLRELSELLGTERLVRVMPNTPCLVGAGAAGIALGAATTPEDAALARQMMEAVGCAVVVSEDLLDAVTGLSGSGPAFVAMFIEAMADGGVLAGLPRSVALQLAAQTVFGTARMVLEENLHPAQLKDAVASPAGTTIAGIHVLETEGLRAAVISAVAAASQRAAELAK